MKAIDGRMTYAWKGWLFRAKDGAIQVRSTGNKEEWYEYSTDLALRKGDGPVVFPDMELRHHLSDLLTYWDKGV